MQTFSRKSQTALAGVGVIVEHNNKFLCLKENFEDKFISKKIDSLTFPQGHLDVDIDPIEMAQIEVLEETGYSVEINNIVGVYFIGKAIGVVFSGELKDSTVNFELKTDESKQVLWLSREEIFKNDNLRPAVREALEDYLEGKSYPLELISNLST